MNYRKQKNKIYKRNLKNLSYFSKIHSLFQETLACSEVGVTSRSLLVKKLSLSFYLKMNFREVFSKHTLL